MIPLLNLLTGLNLLIVPLFVFFALIGNPISFIILFILKMILGLAIDILARKLNQFTIKRVTLLSWGNIATFFAVPICAWWLWPELIRREVPFLVALLIALTVPIVLGFLKYYRFISYHTWMTKAASILVGVGALLLFLDLPSWLFEFSTPFFVFAKLEEIAITTILPEWRFNLPTLWHAIYIELKTAKEMFRETDQKYRAIFSNIEDGYFELDLAGNLTLFNPTLCKYLGYSEKELLGMNNRQVMTEEAAKEAYKIFNEVYRTGKPSQALNLEAVTKDGKIRFFETFVSLRRNSQGEPIGFQCIGRDTTERKRAEEEARMNQEQLFQASKMVALGTLVSGVAHEINNPNNFIMLNTPILREAWESAQPILEEHYKEHGDFLLGGMNYSSMRDKAPPLFSGILDGSRRIMQIVQDLKSFIRKDISDMNQEVDINAVLKSCLSLISNMIQKSTNHFSVNYEENLPAIRGSFQRLEQVFINLIQNACQALPDKQKAIRVKTSCNHERNRVIISFEDEGEGIPRESLPHIADPFFTTKQESGGVGLGLSISTRIVEEHCGKINFESEPGKGTKVEVMLPVRRTVESWKEMIS